MIQLKILSGKTAGTEMVARRFPFSVGRSASSDFPIEEPGVWENHFQINLDAEQNFIVEAHSKTSLVIDGKTVQQSKLRNGEIIEAGAAKILFSLSPTTQKSLTVRECATWIALGFLCIGQIALIYQLLR